jgi:hypothetical protein
MTNRVGRTLESYGYPAVGKCIYCGTTQGRLTREHIIGRGIGGNVTLAKASCAHAEGVKSKKKKCSDITRDIEQFCFNDMLGYIRHRSGMPSSKKLTTLPQTIIHLDKRVEIKDIEIVDHIGTFAVPTFAGPGILIGHTGTPNVGAWNYTVRPEVLAQFPEGTRVGGSKFNGRIFARMLAKIAHAFAAADAGLDAFEPFLPDFILDKSDVEPDFLIGSDDLPPEPETLHRVHLETVRLADKQYLVANIRLLAGSTTISHSRGAGET